MKKTGQGLGLGALFSDYTADITTKQRCGGNGYRINNSKS